MLHKFVYSILVSIVLVSISTTSVNYNNKSNLKTYNLSDSSSISFMVAGHVYGSPGAKNNPFHPPFMSYLDTGLNSKLDFAVFTGDIVQESDINSWNKVDSMLKTLPFKTYFAAGNHDLKNRTLYVSRYGNPNYHFIKKNNLFYFVDLLPSGWNLSQDHLSEIRELNSENKFKNIFVFTHHIPWYNDSIVKQLKVNSTYGRDPNQTFYSHDIFELDSLNTNIYLIGGDVGANPILSELSIHKYKKVHLIASGMGSKEWDNVLRIDIKNDSVNIDVHYLKDHPSFSIDSIYNILHL